MLLWRESAFIHDAHHAQLLLSFSLSVVSVFISRVLQFVLARSFRRIFHLRVLLTLFNFKVLFVIGVSSRIAISDDYLLSLLFV